MAANTELKLLRKKIDALLAEHRPDRYTVSGADEDDLGSEWLDKIARIIEPDVPAATAQELLAHDLVRQQEGHATRTANDVLRAIARTGQLPLDLTIGVGDFPIALEWEEQRDGRTIIRRERVALRAASPDDLDRFELVERRRAAKEHASRNEACDGAADLARMQREAGVTRVDRLPDPGDDEAADNP